MLAAVNDIPKFHKLLASCRTLHKCWTIVAFPLCVDIFVGEQRMCNRYLILTDLKAQVVIYVISESRKQTPKALFSVAYSCLPSKEKEALVCL